MKRTPMPPRKQPMQRQRAALFERRERPASIGIIGNPQALNRAIVLWSTALSTAARPPVTIPKTLRFESEPYRRLVASMPCAICGAVGISQACHLNGGGMGTKHDDRLIFPACADQPGRRGCHMRNDQGGELEKADRRRREAQLVLLTITRVQKARLWPGFPLPDIAELERWAA